MSTSGPSGPLVYDIGQLLDLIGSVVDSLI